MKRTLFAVAAVLAATAYAAPPAGPQLALEVPAESRFTLTATSRVSFGAGSVFTESVLAPGAYQCDERTFGLIFSPGAVRRSCSLTLDPNAAPVGTAPTYTLVAAEGKTYRLTEPTLMRFGANGKWVTATLPAGARWCDRSEFGGVDPIYGVVKSCERVTGAATTTPTTPTTPVVVAPPVVTPTPTDPVVTLPADISAPDKYRAIAATMGTAAGVEYLRGKPSAKPMPTMAYPGPRASYSMADLSGQHSPPKVFPDGVAGGRGCGIGDQSWCGEFQLGKIEGRPGDYSSSIANVGYIPDSNPAGFVSKRYLGVGSYQVLNVGHGTISIKPECSWTTYINRALNNCDNDENAARIAGIQGGSPIGTIAATDKVVSVVRGYGRGGWSTNSLVLMSDGWLYGVGSNTAHNFFKTKVLPEGKQGTALAISNSGEFAFVAVWDTVALKGQVAVVALSDACQWCANEPLSKWYSNWGNHRDEYPGLPGLGNYSGAKLVGYVDLPAGMTAPTTVSVTTGKPKDGDGYQRIQSFWESNLLSEVNRRKFFDGEWADAIPRTGLLVVGSKSEKRAAVIDLRPLFQYYRTQYLTKDQTGFNALIASRGPSATQWPYTFDVAPAQKPVVIKTIDLPSEVTSLALSRTGAARAFIGGLDGKVRVFDLGARYLDQKAVAVGAPTDIAQLLELDAGANVTTVTYLKEKGMNGPQGSRGNLLYGAEGPEDRYWWTLSREERKATLWQFDAAMRTAKVFKTVQTAQIADPIAIEDVDNHGTESYLLTIGDYTGRAIHNIWYGPIVWWTDYGKSGTCTAAAPCLPNGGMEYAGKVNVPGRVHSLGVANIN